MCNPPLTTTGVFPLQEPVFSIRYSGVGHEAAALEVFLQLAMAIVAVMIAAWMLSVTSGRILSTYFHRVFFVAVIGLLFAIFGDLTKFGIGGYPLRATILLAINSLVSWTLAGLVLAWWIKPEPTAIMAE